MAIDPILSILNSRAPFALLRALKASSQRLGGLYAQLATGSAVSPAGDPGKFVAEMALRTELSGVIAARGSIDLGRAAIGLAETTLGGVSDRLIELRGVAIEALGSNDSDTRRVLQNRADQIVQSIELDLGGARFAGRPLFEDFSFDVAGDATGRLQNVSVTQTPVPTGNDGYRINVDVDAVGQSATQTLALSGTGPALLTLRTSQGSHSFSISLTGTSADGAALAASINALGEDTGVTATDNGSGDVELRTNEAGSAQYIAVSDVVGGISVLPGGTNGTDALVRVNGAVAQAAGNHVEFSAGGLGGSFDVTGSGAFGTQLTARGGFTMATDGAGGTYTFGVPAFAPGALGLSALRTGGDSALGTDPASALDLIDRALATATDGRAQLGSVDSTLQRHAAFLDGQHTGLMDAIDTISSVDLASTLVDISREQLLQSATIGVLRNMLSLHRAATLRLLL